MVLIEQLKEKFFENLIFQKFPSHVISVRKEDLLHIQKIKIDLNKIGANLTSDASLILPNLESISRLIIF